MWEVPQASSWDLLFWTKTSVEKMTGREGVWSVCHSHRFLWPEHAMDLICPRSLPPPATSLGDILLCYIPGRGSLAEHGLCAAIRTSNHSISIQQLKFAQDGRVANDGVWGYGRVISVAVCCCLFCFVFVLLDLTVSKGSIFITLLREGGTA